MKIFDVEARKSPSGQSFQNNLKWEVYRIDYRPSENEHQNQSLASMVPVIVSSVAIFVSTRRKVRNAILWRHIMEQARPELFRLITSASGEFSTSVWTQTHITLNFSVLFFGHLYAVTRITRCIWLDNGHDFHETSKVKAAYGSFPLVTVHLFLSTRFQVVEK